MPRIAFIGAGSTVFARKLITDVLSFDELSHSEIVLMDIDEDRLDQIHKITEAAITAGSVDAEVRSTTSRRDALKQADYVLNMINVGGTEPFENEIRIPEQYDVRQAIGDTTGPGGIFRGLRTIPTILSLARDMEDVCPNAVLFNYTNPMTMSCKAVLDATEIETVGLCHSVPHTAEAIEQYVDIPSGSLSYWVAGINHMAWFLRAEYKGESVYPELKEASMKNETYQKDTVRFKMMQHFGVFPTESSHHMSEYLPYFRTDDSTIDKLKGTNYAERMGTGSYLEGWTEKSEQRDNKEFRAELDSIEIERSEEYASRIIHSLETGVQRRFNLNVSNKMHSISNLPSSACVEVPVYADDNGLHPASVGELPPHLALIDQQHTTVYQLAVEGALEHSREKIHQAVQLDPLTAASCNLDEIHAMTEELIEANADYIPNLDWTDNSTRPVGQITADD